jgi:hypothetical protein
VRGCAVDELCGDIELNFAPGEDFAPAARAYVLRYIEQVPDNIVLPANFRFLRSCSTGSVQTMKIVKLKSMGGSGRTTIGRLEIEGAAGDKVSAAYPVLAALCEEQPEWFRSMSFASGDAVLSAPRLPSH